MARKRGIGSRSRGIGSKHRFGHNHGIGRSRGFGHSRFGHSRFHFGGSGGGTPSNPYFSFEHWKFLEL